MQDAYFVHMYMYILMVQIFPEVMNLYDVSIAIGKYKWVLMEYIHYC